MNKLSTLILAACLVSAGAMTAQVEKTVHVETAGTLSTLLTDEEKTTVTDLTVTGNLNGDDLGIISGMVANFPSEDNVKKLVSLDLSGASLENDSIPDNFLYDRYKISGVILPNTVRIIGEYAFYQLISLKSFRFPDSLKVIGMRAFNGNNFRASNELPEGLVSIGWEAFGSSSAKLFFRQDPDGPEGASLPGDTLKIPSTVTYIGNSAFRTEDAPEHHLVILSKNHLTTGNYVFRGMNVKTISLPATEITFGIANFQKCTALTAVTSMRETPLALPDNTFQDVMLENVALYVPETSIGAYKAAPVWSDFGNIEALENITAVAAVETGTPVYPYIANNALVIGGLKGTTTLTVTDISGRTLVRTAVSAGAAVPLNGIGKGIYVIKAGGKTFKVIKK
jgi:hypothetical protein